MRPQDDDWGRDRADLCRGPAERTVDVLSDVISRNRGLAGSGHAIVRRAGPFRRARGGAYLARLLRKGIHGGHAAMTCPYLTEVTMVFCQASPQKKLIPTDRISTASACEAEGYRVCPLYRAAVTRALHVIEEHEEEESVPAVKGEPS